MAGVPYAHRKRQVGSFLLRNRNFAILLDASRELGIDLVAAVTQGSWCKDCDPDSAGFHDGPGVFDLSKTVATGEVELALRKRGVAAWIRDKGIFENKVHIHGVDAFDPNLDEATTGMQVEDYRNGKDGLAGHADDAHLGDLHPQLVKFPDPESETEMEVLMALSSKARDDLGKAVANHKVTSDGTQVSLGGLLVRANRGAGQATTEAKAATKAAGDATKAANKAMDAATGAKAAATGATAEAKAATKAAKDAIDAAKAATAAANNATAAANGATAAANSAARAATLAATEAAKARALAEAAAASSGMTRKDIQGLLAAATNEVASAIAAPHR